MWYFRDFFDVTLNKSIMRVLITLFRIILGIGHPEEEKQKGQAPHCKAASISNERKKIVARSWSWSRVWRYLFLSWGKSYKNISLILLNSICYMHFWEALYISGCRFCTTPIPRCYKWILSKYVIVRNLLEIHRHDQISFGSFCKFLIAESKGDH